jgi:hypothetical protein
MRRLDADDADAASGPFEHPAIVAGSQPVQPLLETLHLLDVLSVRNGIALATVIITSEPLVPTLLTLCLDKT